MAEIALLEETASKKREKEAIDLIECFKRIYVAVDLLPVTAQEKERIVQLFASLSSGYDALEKAAEIRDILYEHTHQSIFTKMGQMVIAISI